jgi:hypothetical protein
MGASGVLGGILIMWDWWVVEKIDECVGRYTVACSLHNTDDNFVWAFGGVYGPNNDRERIIFFPLKMCIKTCKNLEKSVFFKFIDGLRKN